MTNAEATYMERVAHDHTTPADYSARLRRLADEIERHAGTELESRGAETIQADTVGTGHAYCAIFDRG